MKWLREKPTDINETDEVLRFEAEATEVEDAVAGSSATKPKARRVTRNGKLKANGSSSRGGGSPMEVVNDAG
jgi:hypothetical protein